MKKAILFFMFFGVFNFLYAINYTTTAASISWNGAYTSAADGFEAMLYNPAGLHLTNRRFGLNVFGSYGFRFYNNTLSTAHIIKMFQKSDGNISDIIAERITGMSDMGLDTGFDISMLNFMLYVKYEKFSLGFSMIPKTYFTTSIGRTFFSSVFQKLDFSKPISIKITSSFTQYFDFNFIYSTKFDFSKKTKKFDSIYFGVTGHFYLPTLLADLNTEVKIKPGSPNANGITTFDLQGNGSLMIGGLVPHILNLANLNIPNIGLPNDNINKIIRLSETTGFGLGADVGLIFKFNKYIRLGISATDLGFMVIPKPVKANVNFSQNLDITNLSNFGKDFTDTLLSSLNNITVSTTYAFMPAMAFRLGIAITPVYSDYFDMILAADVSLADLHRTVNGEYPSFNVATGIEFGPKIKWFKLPLRLAVNYNTQVNVASFSFGTGLHLGPVEMEIGVKGLEILFSGWGAKEVIVGADFKFEF
ncbi:MAG: hypothetical protein A2086_16525 [Spirochaetes bacterium GWD1_27_9]|nr:MAG: hypothetical protein A2Z98_13210 [Spirochaetes bacterium GWB1_27_13]OHD28310.1 MAG: hypothetical protein A2Y34_09865 [Spirochaetes bacterium GWC1_27_15]OHD29198.1 MAG: hypothetical protein A2086_16525 [Spirochaetes bacterium GWD1_27_9]